MSEKASDLFANLCHRAFDELGDKRNFVAAAKEREAPQSVVDEIEGLSNADYALALNAAHDLVAERLFEVAQKVGKI